jgi:hypothetical protein
VLLAFESSAISIKGDAHSKPPLRMHSRSLQQFLLPSFLDWACFYTSSARSDRQVRLQIIPEIDSFLFSINSL